MDKCQKTLLSYYEKHPKMQIEDLFKFLYQSAFGCSHATCSLEQAKEGVRREREALGDTSPAIQELDGDYCRLSLSSLSSETLGALFYLSAKPEPRGKTDLLYKLSDAHKLIKAGLLPFNEQQFTEKLKNWEANGFPALHHSQEYKENYCPSYRVISKDFARYLPLFCELDRRLERGTVNMCIEGGCASGKSTLSYLLAKVYDCNVFHADDFFLPPQMRTPERLLEVGGNLDRERLESEVLSSLSHDEITYRRFDCSTATLSEPVTVKNKALNIVEGVYSYHPSLSKYYNFSLYLDVSKECQKKRILARNTPAFAERFFNEWIPLEERYFLETDIKNRCNLTLYNED